MLLLPRHFNTRVPPAHNTSGLPGFPAIDVFAKGGTPVCCEFAGTVVKLSGHPPTATTKPGGPYGWSVYIRTPEGTYYLTHLGTRAAVVKVGYKVKKGERIGTVANYSKATNGATASHIHEGFHAGAWAP